MLYNLSIMGRFMGLIIYIIYNIYISHIYTIWNSTL